MNEHLEALQFYRYIQEVLKIEGIDHLTVHLSADDQMEVNAVTEGNGEYKMIKGS